MFQHRARSSYVHYGSLNFNRAMANLTLPNPEEYIGECPHCGTKININPVWFRALQRLLALVNANL